jgi:putative phage-type endonuclease
MLSEKQLAVRSRGIGASEVAALCGLDPYRSPLDIYLRKKGLTEDQPNYHMARGNYLEPALREWASAEIGLPFVTCDSMLCESHPLVLATPDGISSTIPRDTLELKAPGPRTYHEWGDGDDAPDRYVMQVAQQMLVAGAACGYLAAFLGEGLKIYHYERDAELESTIVDVIERFWRDHIEKDAAPPVDGSKTAGEWLAKRFPRNGGKMVTADSKTEELLASLRDTRTELEKLDARKDLLEQQIKEAIGDADGITCPFGKATWKLVKGRSSTDWQSYAKSLGATDDGAKSFIKQADGYRRFLPNFKQ